MNRTILILSDNVMGRFLTNVLRSSQNSKFPYQAIIQKKLAGLQMSFLTLRQANRLQNTHTRHKINGVKLDNLTRRLGTAKN